MAEGDLNGKVVGRDVIRVVKSLDVRRGGGGCGCSSGWW